MTADADKGSAYNTNKASREQGELRRLFHDINGELFLIRGRADLALIGLEGDSPLSTQLKEIIAHTESLGQRIKQAHALCLPSNSASADKKV